MTIKHNLIQGSPEWDEFRRNHFGASEAAAMLGLSKKVTRNQLLHMKATGSTKEFSSWVQENILDYGHEVEALARPLIEKIIGKELYPVTCSEGKLSASCDGLTMSGDIAFEHKQWSASLAESVRNNILPDEHFPQCQQVLGVTGAKSLIFTVSDGTEENLVWMLVAPDQAQFELIKAEWDQFEKDLACYVPPVAVEKPVADTIESLPVATIQAKGEIVLSNLSDILPRFDAFLAGQKTELVTDEDFANGEAVAKFSRDTANKLKLTAKATIDQISSIGDAVRTLEAYAGKFDALGLQLEKLVKSEKEARKSAIINEAKLKWADHLNEINSELKVVNIQIGSPDFLGAVKNKRTIESLQNAVDTALSHGFIQADALAKIYRANLAWLNENASEFNFLYANDLAGIVSKPHDDFRNLINSRIAGYQQAEQAKKEAQAKALLEAQAKAEAQTKIQPSEPIKEAPKADVINLSTKPVEATKIYGRPTDAQIIEVLALHWKVHESKAIEWLLDMDLDKASAQMMEAI